VPRVHDLFADCVAYIYGSAHDAKAGERVGGSGFVVAIPFENNPTFGQGYVITNRHVIAETKTPVVRINRKDGSVEYFHSTQDQWVFHPDGDDIAVLAFDPELPQLLKTFFIRPEYFLTPELAVKEDVGIGDEVFMVGRFINHEGRQQNAPAIRFGNIAMMPKEKIVAPGSGFGQESFLIEIRSLPGYSGSPVFLYSVNAPMDYSNRNLQDEEEQMRKSERERIGKQNLLIDPGFLAHMKAKGPYLFGIDFCHLNTIEPVREKNGDRVPAGWTVRTNSGMAGVIPVWKITELLNQKDLVDKRRAEDEKASRQKLESR
jgi:hypothetical protein